MKKLSSFLATYFVICLVFIKTASAAYPYYQVPDYPAPGQPVGASGFQGQLVHASGVPANQQMMMAQTTYYPGSAYPPMMDPSMMDPYSTAGQYGYSGFDPLGQPTGFFNPVTGQIVFNSAAGFSMRGATYYQQSQQPAYQAYTPAGQGMAVIVGPPTMIAAAGAAQSAPAHHYPAQRAQGRDASSRITVLDNSVQPHSNANFARSSVPAIEPAYQTITFDNGAEVIIESCRQGSFVCLFKSKDKWTAKAAADLKSTDKAKNLTYHYVDPTGRIVGDVSDSVNNYAQHFKIDKNAIPRTLDTQWRQGDPTTLTWWQTPLQELVMKRYTPTTAPAPQAAPQTVPVNAPPATPTPASQDGTIQFLLEKVRALEARMGAQSQKPPATSDNSAFPALPQPAAANYAGIAKKAPAPARPVQSATQKPAAQTSQSAAVPPKSASSQTTTTARQKTHQQDSDRGSKNAAKPGKPAQQEQQSTPQETAEEKIRRLKERSEALLNSEHHQQKALKDALTRYAFQKLVDGADARSEALQDQDKDDDKLQPVQTADQIATAALQAGATADQSDSKRKAKKKKKGNANAGRNVTHDEDDIDKILAKLPPVAPVETSSAAADTQDPDQKAQEEAEKEKQRHKKELREKLHQKTRRGKQTAKKDDEGAGTLQVGSMDQAWALGRESRGGDLQMHVDYNADHFVSMIAMALDNTSTDPYEFFERIGPTFNNFLITSMNTEPEKITAAVHVFIQKQFSNIQSWCIDASKAPENPAMIQAVYRMLCYELKNTYNNSNIPLADLLYDLYKKFPYVPAPLQTIHLVGHSDTHVSEVAPDWEKWLCTYQRLTDTIHGTLLSEPRAVAKLAEGLDRTNPHTSPYITDLQQQPFYSQLLLAHYFLDQTIDSALGNDQSSEVFEQTMEALKTHGSQSATLAHRALGIYKMLQAPLSPEQCAEIEEFFNTTCPDVSTTEPLNPVFMFLSSLYGFKHSNISRADLSIEQYLLSPQAFDPNALFYGQSHHWLKIIFNHIDTGFKTTPEEHQENLSLPLLWADALFNNNMKSLQKAFEESIDTSHNCLEHYTKKLFENPKAIEKCVRLITANQNQIISAPNQANALMEHLKLMDAFVKTVGRTAVKDPALREQVSILLRLIEELPLSTIFPSADQEGRPFRQPFANIASQWATCCLLYHEEVAKFKTQVTAAEKRAFTCFASVPPDKRNVDDMKNTSHLTLRFITHKLLQETQAAIAQGARYFKKACKAPDTSTDDCAQFKTTVENYLAAQKGSSGSLAHLYLVKILKEVNPDYKEPEWVSIWADTFEQIKLNKLLTNKGTLHDLIALHMLQAVVFERPCNTIFCNPLLFFDERRRQTEKEIAVEVAASAQYFTHIVEEVLTHPEKATDEAFENLCKHVCENLPALKEKAFGVRCDQKVTVTFIESLLSFIKALALIPNAPLTGKEIAEYAQFFLDQWEKFPSSDSYAIAHSHRPSNAAVAGFGLMHEISAFVQDATHDRDQKSAREERKTWQRAPWSTLQKRYREYNKDLKKERQCSLIEFLNNPVFLSLSQITKPLPRPEE